MQKRVPRAVCQRNETEAPAAEDIKPDILIGAQADPVGYAYADVQYVKDGTGTLGQIDRSLICLNPIKLWKVGFDGNLAVYDLRYTIAHEIGHAIGLNHPEPHGQLMSMDYLESFRSLQAGDVSGAVRIYGARRAAQRKIAFVAGAAKSSCMQFPRDRNAC